MTGLAASAEVSPDPTGTAPSSGASGVAGATGVSPLPASPARLPTRTVPSSPPTSGLPPLPAALPPPAPVSPPVPLPMPLPVSLPAPATGTACSVVDSARAVASATTRLSIDRVCGAVSRSAGSFASSPSTTGRSGPAFTGAVSSSVMTAVRVASAEPRSYGGRPSTIAYSVPPSDHRSAGGPGFCPWARSGDMYEGAPTSIPVEVTEESPSTLAMPKSVSTTRPSSPISTLDGLTSRCRMPCACAALSTPSTSSAISAARAGASGPSSRMTSASERDSTSSMTIHGRSSSSTTSKTVTAEECRIRAVALASRRVRTISRCFSSSSTLAFIRSSLTATVRPSISSSARHTVPMPPRPSTASSR